MTSSRFHKAQKRQTGTADDADYADDPGLVTIRAISVQSEATVWPVFAAQEYRGEIVS